MTEHWWRPFGSKRSVPVDEVHPLPTFIPEDPWTDKGQPPVAGRTVVRQRVVPGIATGVAYADKDVMGTTIEFPNMVRELKKSGMLLGGSYFDVSDQGLQVDLLLFSRAVTPTGADNTALVITDAEMLFWIATLQFTTFYDLNTSQISDCLLSKLFTLNGTSIFGVAQTRGVLTVAAGNLPLFALQVLPD